MTGDAHAPRNEGGLLRRVIEEKNPCPTLLDLDRLAKRRAESPVATLGQPDQWVESHLLTCESCLDLYEGLKTLATAARRALDTAMSEVS